MKKILFIAFALSLTVHAGGLNVQCGIPPLVSVVRAVGGDRVQTGSLMSSGQDPHVWSPSPKAVAGVRNADLFLTVGMPFENVVAEKLAAMNPDLRVMDVAEGLAVSGDPHVWMSLPSLSVMADVVEQALSAADPDGAAGYRANRELYQRGLAEAHERVTQKLAPFRGKTFYVYHPVFGFFAKDYDLNQGVVELDGKSPSPKQLLGLIRRAREEDVRVVFVQPQFSDKSARILAERIGGQVVQVNPLAEDTAAVIKQAAVSIAQAYAPRQKP